MRIIFVTDTMTSGGAERVISILANSLSLNHNVEIICLRGQEVFYKISSKVNIVFLDKRTKSWINKLIWLRTYIKNDDIVLPFMVKVYCVVLLSQLFKPCIIIPSERNDPRHLSIVWRTLRMLLLRKATLFIVQTESIKSYFSKNIKKKTLVIYNPIELTQCGNKQWNQNSKTIIAIGRTDKQKNYSMMIKAFSRLHQHYPEYSLEIWSGRGEQENELRILIQSLDAENFIKMKGRTDEVAKLYEKAYMFIMSSNYEGFSNSLMEALCSGLPVVSTKVSGATDVIVNGENGLLVDVGDEDAFLNAMMKLIQEPKLANKLANNARCNSSLFECESICNKWNSVIKQFLK